MFYRGYQEDRETKRHNLNRLKGQIAGLPPNFPIAWKATTAVANEPEVNEDPLMFYGLAGERTEEPLLILKSQGEKYLPDKIHLLLIRIWLQEGKLLGTETFQIRS